MFDDPFDKYFGFPPEVPAQDAGKADDPEGVPAGSDGPKLAKAPEIQPCQFGFPCNDCGYCH